MELKEFIENFAEQFEETDPSLISEETRFQELDEWSSLTALGVIGFVKTAFGKTITGKEIRACQTIKELYNFVINS